MISNRQIVLAARPAGFPAPSDFRLEQASLPGLDSGQFLVRNIYLSVDPYMRGRMSDRKSYIPSFQIGKPLEGSAVGRVVKSNHPRYSEGDWVTSLNGWRDYFVSSGEGVNKIDTRLAPPAAYLGVLGVPGFTAWYGMKHIGKPTRGETLVVSAAAGAVGSVVVQLGKIYGCRVVAIAGSEDKCAFTRELGADDAVNYKAGDVYEQLRTACPKGVDIYFENVGGAIFDAVLRLVNPFSRIPLCGMISQYNLAEPEPGPRYLFSMVANRTLMQGFIISDHFDRFPEFLLEVGGYVRSGRIRWRETVVEGLENAPRAFIGMLQGANTGKMLVKIADEPDAAEVPQRHGGTEEIS